jgi:hypothetical protein
VFILADDLGINDLHCYGRADHHTPNLDKLATQGCHFPASRGTESSPCPPTWAVPAGSLASNGSPRFQTQPKEGRRLDGENSNYGVVKIDGAPWETLTTRMKEVNAEIEGLHAKAAAH